ncbi:hypothetical protein BC629DRAFT_915457 [Irpex lacteus]|nr:hypothetical protein BC629DRAFT_915457 [Irpex lacteus]
MIYCWATTSATAQETEMKILNLVKTLHGRLIEEIEAGEYRHRVHTLRLEYHRQAPSRRPKATSPIAMLPRSPGVDPLRKDVQAYVDDVKTSGRPVKTHARNTLLSRTSLWLASRSRCRLTLLAGRRSVAERPGKIFRTHATSPATVIGLPTRIERSRWAGLGKNGTGCVRRRVVHASK